ncbi:MAG: asparagine--tRNA ligase, partial [Planctomycetota bacterium]
DEQLLKRINTGACIAARGELVESKGKACLPLIIDKSEGLFVLTKSILGKTGHFIGYFFS